MGEFTNFPKVNHAVEVERYSPKVVFFFFYSLIEVKLTCKKLHMFNVYNLMHLDIRICLLHCHHSRVINISSSSKFSLCSPFLKVRKLYMRSTFLTKF